MQIKFEPGIISKAQLWIKYNQQQDYELMR